MDLRLRPLDPAGAGDGRHQAEDVRRAAGRARGRPSTGRRNDAQAGRARTSVWRRQGSARGTRDPGRRRTQARYSSGTATCRVTRRQLRHRPGRQHARRRHGRDRQPNGGTSSAAASATAARATRACTPRSGSSTASGPRSRTRSDPTIRPAGPCSSRGTGAVGAKLTRLLLDAGAIVLVSDVDEERARATGAQPVAPDTAARDSSATSTHRARSARR